MGFYFMIAQVCVLECVGNAGLKLSESEWNTDFRINSRLYGALRMDSPSWMRA